MTANFNWLWNNTAASVLATRKDIQEFAQMHESNGNVLIFVKGIGRYVKWKSVGAGLYKVYTEENPME